MSYCNKISIIGRGAFGTALGRVFENALFDVFSYGRDFPKELATDIIFLAVPTRSIHDVLSKLTLQPHQTLILCCKGLLSDGQVPSSILPPSVDYAILSGPGYAQQLGMLHPTIHSLASSDPDRAKTLAHSLSTPSLRLYWTTDVLGVQLCGALKNPIAIASGIAHGLGFSHNTCAAIITRGAHEIQQILAHLGGKSDTLLSPAGIGDIVLTCNSSNSRNFRFGEEIAKGRNPQAAEASIGTVEGLSALTGLMNANLPLELPLIRCLERIIQGDLTPHQGVSYLMERPITNS